MTRLEADHDLALTNHSLCSKRDPSTQDGVRAKMELDATKPLDAQPMRYLRIRVPEEDVVDLNNVMTGENRH